MSLLSPQDFVAHEARLLDEKRFDEWLTLFAEDGLYWVPLAGAAQRDARQHNSIALEDRLLLALRVARLGNPRAHSQHPASFCQHVLQAPRIEAAQPVAGAVVEGQQAGGAGAANSHQCDGGKEREWAVHA